ncbi:hypothetical protein QMG83_03400 [Salinibacterium sp. G-O1]|uniref:hypothetical protein n=1 Tax=Salinibacterium sp. G-O1 TaxID=3046208 RepID=UPI0024B9E483|nr:hypothetical protein [Salinibacterium sp. G-O1]MDJ0334265.1 hypothetical protein [Salinibacterium sp. G-O1]
MIQIIDRDLNINYSGPAPADVPIPAIKERLQAFVDAYDRTVRNGQGLALAERALLDAQSADEARTAALYEEGKDDADHDPTELQTLAEIELKKANARLQPGRLVLAQAHSAFRESIPAHKVQWQKLCRKDAELARDKLALAFRQMQLQYASLETSMGVLELLAPADLPYGHVTAQWGEGRVQLDEAIQRFDHALDVIVNRLRAL